MLHFLPSTIVLVSLHEVVQCNICYIWLKRTQQTQLFCLLEICELLPGSGVSLCSPYTKRGSIWRNHIYKSSFHLYQIHSANLIGRFLPRGLILLPLLVH